MSAITTQDDPRKLDNDTLAKFVASLAGSIAEQLEGLQPYYVELRQRFHHIRKGEAILGCPTWGEYCDRVLHRTRRAINYWLAGGNPVSKRQPALPAAPERETVSQLPAALESAVSQLTPQHFLIGKSSCRWCDENEDCEHPCECSVLVEPYTDDGFFWIMIMEDDLFGGPDRGCGLAGNKKAIAEQAVGLFINLAMSKAQNLPQRMVYEVYELPPDYEKKDYNQYLYASRKQWFEREVLGHAPPGF
jgi:hypothetical protein